MMVRLFFLGILYFSVGVFWARGQSANQLQLLLDELGGREVSAVFEDVATWRADLNSSWVQAITNLPDSVKEAIIVQADQANEFTWPSLMAMGHLEFRDNGNRNRYESVVSARRGTLAKLVAGELVSRSGTYMPQIANGLWLILEESTWVSPAHMNAQRAGNDLPDPDEQIVDLGAGRIAADLAAIRLLLGDELDAISPQINRRIQYELDRRILTPYLDRDDFWWMGFNTDFVNNWNIWINNNVLRTVLLAEDDESKRGSIIQKLLQSADRFLAYYPADGSCDEGPSYWGHAGGELILLIDWLNKASGQKLDWSANPFIHSIGTYIYKMHIVGDRFVNFADASAKLVPPPVKVLTYGKMYQDTLLQQFAAYLFDLQGKQVGVSTVMDFLLTVENLPQLLTESPHSPKVAHIVMQGMDIVGWRSDAGMDGKGLFFMGIGSNNGVSHNHNDVGNFVLYADGEPVVIDAGVGTYTRETFSANRYNIWTMQSQWHNVPTINGAMQQYGSQYMASAIRLPTETKPYHFSMDIAKAYPQEAGVLEWARAFSFDPKRHALSITDSYRLQTVKAPQQFNYLTAQKPIVVADGKIAIPYGEDGRQINLLFAKNTFDVSMIEKELDDSRLSTIWGNAVYRIVLTEKLGKLKNKHQFTFTK